MNEANGIWIPAEIWSLDLNPMQRVLIARVQCLAQNNGTSWAGDEYLAKELRCTVPYIRKLRKGLEELGYLTRTGYGYTRKLNVNLRPEVPIVTSSNSHKFQEEQVPIVTKEVPVVSREVPIVTKEVPIGAHSKEYSKEYSKEEVKKEETELEIIKRLMREQEARERGEPTTFQKPKEIEIVPAGGAARAAVVSNKAQPFDAEEVRDYFLEVGDPDPNEADNFYDYWLSRGWRDKAGPIKDWKARARTWMRSEFRKPRKKSVGERVREMMQNDELNQHR